MSTSQLAAHRGTLRAAVLTGYPELARQFGADPVALMARAGLDTRALIEPDLQIEAGRLNRLLELTARETGTEDFGLRLAQMHGIANLGPIGILAREEPDVGSAMKILIDYLYLHNRAAHIRVEHDGALAVMATWLDFGEGAAVRQALDLMVGAMVGILRAFLGRDWNPVRVQLMYPPPRRTDGHRRYFRCRVDYDQPLNAILIRDEDWRAPIRSASPEFERQMRRWVEALAESARSNGDFAHELRRLVQMLLPFGKCSAERVARYYALDRRTVHRRLAASGLSFAQVVNDVRKELAQRHVAEGRQALAEVADMLGFAHASAFTRWFTTEFGSSPTRWRRTRA